MKYRITIDSDNIELLTCIMHIIKKTDVEAYLYKVNPEHRITILEALDEVQEIIAYIDATGIHTKEEGQ